MTRSPEHATYSYVQQQKPISLCTVFHFTFNPIGAFHTHSPAISVLTHKSLRFATVRYVSVFAEHSIIYERDIPRTAPAIHYTTIDRATPRRVVVGLTLGTIMFVHVASRRSRGLGKVMRWENGYPIGGF